MNTVYRKSYSTAHKLLRFSLTNTTKLNLSRSFGNICHSFNFFNYRDNICKLPGRHFSTDCSIKIPYNVLPMKTSKGPVGLYLRKCESDQIIFDKLQYSCVFKLESIYDDIMKFYSGNIVENNEARTSWFTSLYTGSRDVKQKPLPNGVYIHGSPGSGKTFIMDLLYDSLPKTLKKKRVHFNNFMLDIHHRLHQYRLKYGSRSDPIPLIAKEISEESNVVCFDEFQVTDVGDAMILKYLFTNFFNNNMTFILTSNRPPIDLYKDGVQRDRFLPFIDLLQHRCPCLVLDSGIDYRYGGEKELQTYMVPNDCYNNSVLDGIFKKMSKNDWPPRPVTIDVQMGRALTVPSSTNGIAYMSFDDLCVKPLGAADYIALSTNFHTIIIKSIPIINKDQMGILRRFITLIDILYQYHVKIICCAEEIPSKLFQCDKCCAEDEVFAFDRCVSRLTEMQSKKYKQILHPLQKMELKNCGFFHENTSHNNFTGSVSGITSQESSSTATPMPSFQ